MSERILNNIFNYAAQEQAGRLVIARDLEKGQRLNCHYHLPDGEIRTMALPAGIAESFLASLKRVAALAPGELAAKKYCRVRTKRCQLNFYLTIIPDKAQEKIILHIIPSDDKLWRFSQLGMSASDRRQLLNATKKSGLILLSSPDRSGKSATLYSLLAEVNNSEKNVYLITGAPEAAPAGVNCLPPSPDNWTKVLRHDPDIIVADDLDKDESLISAIRAAATGRLVIGAVAADSASDVLKKILKLPLPLKLKLDQIKIITNQRLISLRRTGKKKPLAKKRDQREKIGIFEILPLTDAWRKKALSVASKRNSAPLLITEEDGWRPLAADKRQKIKDGLIAA